MSVGKEEKGELMKNSGGADECGRGRGRRMKQRERQVEERKRID